MDADCATGSDGTDGSRGSNRCDGADRRGGPGRIHRRNRAAGHCGGKWTAGYSGNSGVIGATGATGPIGPAGITFRGVFTSGTYGLNDVVTYQNSTWLSTAASNVATPPAAPWSLLAPAGATGAVGATGATGAAGVSGATGATGVTGATGPQGFTGPTGATGSAGALGPAGVTGPTGATGATGAAGSAANTMTFTSCTLGSNCSTAPPGNTFLVTFVGGTNLVQNAFTSPKTGIIGVALNDAATGGSATIQLVGPATCTFENTAIAGDYVQAADSHDGQCLDVGTTYPTSNQIVGIALSSGAGAQTIYLLGPEVDAVSGGGGAIGPTGATGPTGTTDPTGATGLAGATGPTGSTGATGTAWNERREWSSRSNWSGLDPAGPTGAAGSGGTGSAPSGIQYAVNGHSATAGWVNPAGSAQTTTTSGLTAAVVTIAPTACKPGRRLRPLRGAATTWTLFSVTGSTSSGWSAASSLLSFSTAATAGSSTSGVTSSTVAAGTIMTLTSGTSTAGANPGGGGYIVAFSCQ